MNFDEINDKFKNAITKINKKYYWKRQCKLKS